MLIPVFTLKLNQKVIPRTVAVGHYDGKNPTLTAATNAGKVFLHNSHGRQRMGGRMEASSLGELSLLNINQSVTSLCAGPLNPNLPDKDILVVGTQTNVLAYDVDDNADLFHKEVADGANVVTIGYLGDIEQPLAIVGGNCSLMGTDYTGEDPFWTVTGDNVCSLCLLDFKQQGKNMLVVGSEDYDIRVFDEDEIVAEMTETDVITSLCPMAGARFGYALANGTVGVYDRTARYWRIKSKNHAVSIGSYDLNGDGALELITGWSNGKIDARSARTGEVIYKDTFNSAIAGVVCSDYKQEGKEQLLCCSTDGEVRGYLTAPESMKNNLTGANLDQDAIRELSNRKHHLMKELDNYAENRKVAVSVSQGSKPIDTSVGFIPAGTQLQTSIYIDPGDPVRKTRPRVVLKLSTNNDTVIKAAIVFAEGLFEGESHVIHPKENELLGCMDIDIVPPKDVPNDLHLKAFISSPQSSDRCHVFELTRQLPRFSMYILVQNPSSVQKPNSGITFPIKERVQRIVLWINQSFLLDEDLVVTDSTLEVAFISQRSGTPLFLLVNSSSEMSILTDSMDTAGDVLQSLAAFLNIEHMNVTADFPTDMADLSEILQKVDEFHSVRQKLTADMADHSNLIKSMVVRAEDSRLMDDLVSMKRYYMELYDLNRDLINGYKIRCNNHNELLAYLKRVNQYIQKAGRLRVGKFKTQVISECRTAIKNNNVSSLFKIIKSGSS